MRKAEANNAIIGLSVPVIVGLLLVAGFYWQKNRIAKQVTKEAYTLAAATDSTVTNKELNQTVQQIEDDPLGHVDAIREVEQRLISLQQELCEKDSIIASLKLNIEDGEDQKTQNYGKDDQ